MSQPPSTPPSQRPQESGDTPWAQFRKPVPGRSPWGTKTDQTAGPQTVSRARKIAEGLPDWDPLPPGETVTRRPGNET